MLSFQTTILTISLSDPHNDILTGTRVCYLSTRKGFIFRWCKSTKNTRLGYKVCVKKSKARFDLEKKNPQHKVFKLESVASKSHILLSMKYHVHE